MTQQLTKLAILPKRQVPVYIPRLPVAWLVVGVVGKEVKINPGTLRATRIRRRRHRPAAARVIPARNALPRVYYALYPNFYRRRFLCSPPFCLSSKGRGRFFSAFGLFLAQGAVTVQRRKLAANESQLNVIQLHTEQAAAELLRNHFASTTKPPAAEGIRAHNEYREHAMCKAGSRKVQANNARLLSFASLKLKFPSCGPVILANCQTRKDPMLTEACKASLYSTPS